MYASETQHIWMQWKLGLLNTDYILSTHPVKELIKDKTAKFDLVVADQFNQEAMYLFAHKFNCPLVTIGRWSIRLEINGKWNKDTIWNVEF